MTLRTMPLLVMLAGVLVVLRHVARPCWLIEVFVLSDVAQVPWMSGASGQFPPTLDCVMNCTWFPGGAKAWSAVALAGDTLAVIVQLLCVEPPHPTTPAPHSKRASAKG